MRPILVRYERLKNLGNYEHVKVGVEVQIEEGETASDAISRAKKFVDAELDPKISDREINVAKHIIDNQDDYSPKQVREAKATLENVYSDIPF